jgi:hypothetical protein
LYPPLNPEDIDPIVELPVDDVTYRLERERKECVRGNERSGME